MLGKKGVTEKPWERHQVWGEDAAHTAQLLNGLELVLVTSPMVKGLNLLQSRDVEIFDECRYPGWIVLVVDSDAAVDVVGDKPESFL